ncbi:hypothetical protein QP353_04265 [Klebsiella aerogenes]|uniref:hypothetical protein n=1 Tax=Klebsiella aerogenes TaxID=548 RepID=UPI00254EDF78|nr:hypothetical protein [Klebsiella aerogenes]MDK6928644.1 hypothetical protein [Klebsiella aerogenes]
MNVYEMEGFLRGKCIPGDLKVNESNAEYLVRKLNAAVELHNELTAALLTIEKSKEESGCPADVDLQDWVKQLAAENVGMKEDRDTLARYWIEDGGDKDCAMSYCEPTPATDRIVAEAEARGVEKFAAEQRGVAERLKKRGGDVVTSSVKFCISSAEEAEDFAKQLREGAGK